MKKIIRFITDRWEYFCFILIIVVFLQLPYGCANVETRKTAANISEAGKRVESLGAERQDPELRGLGDSIHLGADVVRTDLGQLEQATVTAEMWKAKWQQAKADADKQRDLAKQEHAENEALRGTIADGGRTLLGLLGPWGAVAGSVGFGLLTWLQKGKWRDVAHNAIALGRQMTVVAEETNPVVVQEIKDQFARVQEDKKLDKYVLPILNALKAAEPVLDSDLEPTAPPRA